MSTPKNQTIVQTFAEIAQLIRPVSEPAGKVILAMTRGEVHDTGKTVIKGLFQYNGLEVVDLGVLEGPEVLLQAVADTQPQAVGLSAMLNSSLGEMQELACRLAEAGCTVPLLIGGAATTLAHTAVFIAPQYTTGLTVHVHDVHYCQKIIPQLADPQTLAAQIRPAYEEVRRQYRKTQTDKKILTYAEARAGGLQTDWPAAALPAPSFLGTKIFKDYDLTDVFSCMDWTTLFMSYGMKGKFPSIVRDKHIGEAAKILYSDAQVFLQEVLDQKLLKAHAALGFFKANSVGDDIEIYNGEKTHLLHTLRQQARHGEGKPYYALADFVAPKESGLTDYVGAFVLTAGDGLAALVERYEAEGNLYKAIMARSLADILAESFAERLHERVRKEFWGYVPEENLTMEEKFRCFFQGIRPAPGYPACPDHSEKPLLFQLLDAKRHTGVSLTESFAMAPAPSICGVYFAHPDSAYFWIGALGEDQLGDYARRKGADLKEIKKQLIFHVTTV